MTKGKTVFGLGHRKDIQLASAPTPTPEEPTKTCPTKEGWSRASENALRRDKKMRDPDNQCRPP